MRLLDTRFAGIAKGVGTANILGRVHSAQIKLADLHLPCAFTVMEGRDVDLLFGLDMLKAHQACIDLGKNVLRIQGREVKFLAEHELPAKARDSVLLADSDSGADSSQQRESSSEGRQNMPNHRKNTVLRRPVPSQAGASTALQWAEKDIQTLMGFGVTRDIAIQMLEATNGNVDAAASILFS